MLPEELKVTLHYLTKLKGFNIVQFPFQRSNKTRNVCITSRWGTFAQPLLQWTINILSLYL